MASPCVKCGYCCTVNTCFYGEWDEKRQQCAHLQEANQTRQRFRKIWNTFEDKESDANSGMCGSGCSSTLFNSVRDAVIRGQDLFLYLGGHL